MPRRNEEWLDCPYCRTRTIRASAFPALHVTCSSCGRSYRAFVKNLLLILVERAADRVAGSPFDGNA